MNLKFLIPICFNEEFKKREFNFILSARNIYSNLKNIKSIEDYINKFFMITDDKMYKIKKISLGEVDYINIDELINGNFTLFSMNDPCLIDCEKLDNMEFILRIEVKNWYIYDMVLTEPEEEIEVIVVNNGKFVRNFNKILNYKGSKNTTEYQYSYYGSAI